MRRPPSPSPLQTRSQRDAATESHRATFPAGVSRRQAVATLAALFAIWPDLRTEEEVQRVSDGYHCCPHERSGCRQCGRPADSREGVEL